jgi:hypothetical protein
MMEVKKREDEYHLVKDISASIKGLPPQVQLARRERRLLNKGLLLRVGSGPQTETAQSGTQDHAFPQSQTDGSPLAISDLTSPQHTSRLFDAINEWGIRRERSGSVKSFASSALSFKSYETATTTSSSDLMTPSSDISSYQYGNDSPSRTMVHDYSYAKHHSTRPVAGQQQSEACEVYVFVFTDLVLLVAPLSTKHIRPGQDSHKWQVLDDIGMGRVLGVMNYVGGKCSSLPWEAVVNSNIPDLGPEIVLDLLPIEPSELDTGVIPDNSPVTTIHLAVQSFGSSNKHPELDNDGVLQEWLSAFQQCFQFTLRSLSFPSPSGRYLVHGPNVDLEADTRESVMAILNSGLPIPKSPSIQMEDAQLGYPEDTRRQEREERGWWSLRFQQVLREMQRQEVPLVFTF